MEIQNYQTKEIRLAANIKIVERPPATTYLYHIFTYNKIEIIPLSNYSPLAQYHQNSIHGHTYLDKPQLLLSIHLHSFDLPEACLLKLKRY